MLIIQVMLVILVMAPGYLILNSSYLAWKKKEEDRKSVLGKLEEEKKRKQENDALWQAPVIDSTTMGKDEYALINYGRELITNTAFYLGPKGKVAALTNGMNCQNCHLDAGSRPWGNNYGAVYATYPKYRARSGSEEDINRRINDCMERSLNGKALALDSREMQALKAYIEFIGSSVHKGEKPQGSGIYELPYPEKALDTLMGKTVYTEKCVSCHQLNGEGIKDAGGIVYTYPPLWGPHSYNEGAGLFRISRFAGYVIFNMPQGATFLHPQLTQEEAWNVAAYVNSQPRPKLDLSKDWPVMSEKPVDHPFGPYADPFPESQHKYGPYQPIKDFYKNKKKG
ncbi:MAG: c-type cytochrome [Saprospiraceae bacterium]|nr:c-type cytochrome [Saprospiraceae bacterium]